MFVNVLRTLWADQSGAVLSTEYIMLGSIVAAGGSTGMVALRDSMTEECKDFGASIGELRRSHMPQMNKPGTKGLHQQHPADSGQLPYWAMSSSGTPVCVNCATMSP